MLARISLGLTAIALAILPQLAFAQLPEALRDAARAAVVSNPEVQMRWHAFRAAGAEQDVARSGYLPQLDAVVSTGAERRSRAGQGSDRFGRSGVTLSLNQMVFDGFFTRSEVSRLGHARLARYYEIVEASEIAALEASRAYADVLRFRELVRFAQENYAAHRMVYDQIAERVQAGVGRRVDLEQAAGRLALSESNLLTEVSNLHDVSARFLRVVGVSPVEALPPFEHALDVATLPPTVQDALRQAFVTSPSINAAVEAVRAGQSGVDTARAAFQPRVDLRARQLADRNRDNVSGSSRDSVVELVLSYNLYRGGADQARLRQAAEVVNQNRDMREKACRDLRQTLSIAYNDVERLREQLRYLDQHQLAVARTRTAYRQQFDIGQRSLLDLLDTENEYFQARRAYENARIDQIVAQLRTLAGMGQLMRALEVAREDLPSIGELDAEREAVDPDSLCPPEAPGNLEVDKEAVLAEALRAAGR
jgi:adhesin transport system outer membrane protein